MPDALISSTTSRGPGVGSGKSRSSSFRSPTNTTPFMQSSHVSRSGWLGQLMQFDQLRRRAFISLLGGAAAAWPLAARAQQGERLRRIGVVMGLPASDPGGRSEFVALKQGLEDLGWIDGRNFEIKARWGGEPDRVQASAKELVGLPCEVIIARSTPVTAAVLNTIPVVFAVVVDPVGSGFVQSFARPGGNVTGFQNYEFTMVGKWLQML